MSKWGWFDAFKKGDDQAFSRALADETDRSLAKDPGRWSWGKTVEETVEDEPTITRHRSGRGGHVADRRHHTGKGRVSKGESGERTTWRDSEWRNAREDYQRQNPRPYERWPGEDDRR
jgi:hypothetical protein